MEIVHVELVDATPNATSGGSICPVRSSSSERMQYNWMLAVWLSRIMQSW